MVIVKVGERFHIKKKDGKPGKTSFASRKAAENAQRNLKKLSAKGKPGSKKNPKKKTTKKKNPKGGKKMAKKRSLIGLARLAVYALTAGSAAITVVSQTGFTTRSLKRIANAYSATNEAGQFSGNQAKATYTPLAIWSGIDMIASKAGVYRRAGAL